MGWDPDGHRTIRRVEQDEFQIISNPDAPAFIYAPPDSREVVLYHADGFTPDTLYIHRNQVHITEWESIWSTAFRLNPVPPDDATFAPIIDSKWTIVGHVGWADGTNIVVPEPTIRNSRRFWFLLQKARLDKERQQLLDDDARFDRARPFADSPFGRMSREKKAVPRPDPRFDTRWDEARRGPLADRSIEDTYRIDLDLFVKGGGKAFVGRNFLERGQALYLPSIPGVPDGRLGSPKTLYSSGYQFLVLVDPAGRIQRVMGVRNNVVNYGDLVIPMIELAFTLSMIVDILPLAVVLLAAGVRIATRVMIEAVSVIIDREAKELVELTMEELAKVMGGGVIPKDAAELAARAAASGVKEGTLTTEEMIAHLTEIVRQRPELRRLMAARVLTEQRLTSATLEALGDWARAYGRRIEWKTQAEIVKVTKDAENLMTLQGNELWINAEARSLKEAQEFYKEAVHELISDSLGYRGRGVATRVIESPNGTVFTDQTLLENAVLRGDIEGVVRFFAGG